MTARPRTTDCPTGHCAGFDPATIEARVARCAHPTCRTSLTEDDAVQCPHGLSFCQHCTWEEACDECGVAADEARAVA